MNLYSLVAVFGFIMIGIQIYRGKTFSASRTGGPNDRQLAPQKFWLDLGLQAIIVILLLAYGLGFFK